MLVGALCVCVWGLCLCVNSSGNDSAMTGPVGIVQWSHFQVPVSTFFFFALTLSVSVIVKYTHRPSQLCGGIVNSIDTISGACSWYILLSLEELQTLISTLQPSRVNATHIQNRTDEWELFHLLLIVSVLFLQATRTVGNSDNYEYEHYTSSTSIINQTLSCEIPMCHNTSSTVSICQSLTHRHIPQQR